MKTEQFQLPGHNVRGIIDMPETAWTRGVVFLPGLTGGAGTRFDPFAKSVTDAGMAVMRVDAWPDQEHLMPLSIREVHRIIDEAIAVLEAAGATSVVAVGKSFGGGMLLTYPAPRLSRRVLWAPAIGWSEESGNIEDNMDTMFEAFTSWKDLHTSRELLSRQISKYLIINGTKDDVVTEREIEQLSSALQDCEVVTLVDATHALDEHPDTIATTIAFLKQD